MLVPNLEKLPGTFTEISHAEEWDRGMKVTLENMEPPGCRRDIKPDDLCLSNEHTKEWECFIALVHFRFYL